jgi:6-pyruvoyltetrahydropterin/6-carboxytetrahydropterin synthase
MSSLENSFQGESMPGIFEVSIETHFCSAHALRDYKGATEPTHGHNFRVIVTVSGRKIDKAGMLIDFLELKPLIDDEVGRLNYGFLNESVEEFRLDGGKLSPSAENIAFVLFERLRKRIPAGVNLCRVQVFEAPGSSATYREEP